MNLNKYLHQVVMIWWKNISHVSFLSIWRKKRFGELQLPRNLRLGHCVVCDGKCEILSEPLNEFTSVSVQFYWILDQHLEDHMLPWKWPIRFSLGKKSQFIKTGKAPSRRLSHKTSVNNYRERKSWRAWHRIVRHNLNKVPW